ncbi:Uncharacterized protein Fot_03668 [Forsythia ovata]|uniref:Uncharacterized protein n=1 Tax=Forsythia ovata TaxID=205694 RepID=A0ABD1XAC6_9LAMI
MVNKHDSIEDILDERDGDEECKSSGVNNSPNAEIHPDPRHYDSFCDPHDNIFTEDVLKQVDKIMKDAERPKHSNSIEFYALDYNRLWSMWLSAFLVALLALSNRLKSELGETCSKAMAEYGGPFHLTHDYESMVDYFRRLVIKEAIKLV